MNEGGVAPLTEGKIYDVIKKAVMSFSAEKKIPLEFVAGIEGSQEKVYDRYCNPSVYIGLQNPEEVLGLKFRDYIENFLSKASMSEINVLIKQKDYLN